MVNEHKPEDWYITFLTSYILLHNYELQMKFQSQFAARRLAKVGSSVATFSVVKAGFAIIHSLAKQVRYLDMPLVRATNSGAKTILAHFHYCCKGQKPFGEGFDWNAPKIRKMARLDAEQSRFMASYRDRVIQKGAWLTTPLFLRGTV